MKVGQVAAERRIESTMSSITVKILKKEVV